MKIMNNKLLSSIQEEIELNNIIITQFDNMHNQPSCGYCYQIENNFIIKLFNGIKNIDVYNFLLAHEVRHVSHGHFHPAIKDVTVDRISKIINDKIKSMDNTLKQSIAKNDKDLVNRLYNYFYNIAADMEVNSKLIEDYDTFVKISDSIMLEIEEFDTVINNLKDDIKYGIHPSNLKEIYGKDTEDKPLSFPTKMDFIYYMEELVKNVDFNSLQVEIVSSVSQDSINKNENGEMKDIEDFKESNSKKKQKELETLKDDREEKDSQDSTPGNQNSQIEKLLTEYTVYNLLRKYIYKNIKVDKLNEYTDILYNYNRRKFSNDTNQVLIPKYKPLLKEHIASVVIVADVSGSMSEYIINNIVKTIFQMKLPNKLFKLITWNTELVEEFDIKSKHPNKIKIGGGTKLVDSLPYVNKYLNNESKLFVISDLDDKLEDWKKEMENISVPESNIFIIDVYNRYNVEADKLFTHYYNLFCRKL